jgi:hypothetical protein
MKKALLLLSVLHLAIADPREALSKIYTSTQGSNWEYNDFWMSEEHHCQWFGIECHDGVIVKIELSNNNLDGPIPEEIGFFTDVEVLNFRSNRISGSIPNQLKNLKAIDLNLEHNLICGKIPVEAANEALLRNWKIVKKNPLLFSDCNQGLQRRKLEDNIGCSADESDSLITLLDSLYSALDGASWTNKDNWGVGCPCDNWYGIECDTSGAVLNIDLSKNNLVGSLPGLPDIEGSKLENMDLCCNSISGSLPDGLGFLAGLDSLNLGNNQICGDINNPVPDDVRLDEGLDNGVCLGNSMVSDKNFEILGNSIGTFCPTGTPTSSPTRTMSPTDYVCGMGGVGADALCPFYETTSGSTSWENKKNWMHKKPCTNSWYGVMCEDVGTPSAKVVGIKLNENRLLGYINTEMGLLTDMQHKFNLQKNTLIGNIPSELGQYTGLTDMFGLGSNFISEKIPSELGLMTALTGKFHLYDNVLTGCIPTELGMLTSMKNNFNVQDNKLACAIPSELGELTFMTKGFSLADNSLVQEIPSELFLMTELVERFNLQSNMLTGCIPPEIGQMSQMTRAFDLKANSLSCTIPTEVGMMSLMENYFFLHSNRLSGQVPVEFSQMTNLNVFDAASAFNLKNNELCGDIPDAVQQMAPQCHDHDSCAAWEIEIANSIGTPC